MSLIMQGTDFGKVFNSSGARNFFPKGDIGNGWRQHALLNYIPGHSWKGSAFTAKTTTFDERYGNLNLRPDLQPRKLFPPCVYVDWPRAIVLNDVNLSGPGAGQLLRYGVWQNLTEPFLISFMSVAGTEEKRLEETIEFCNLMKDNRQDFRKKFGLQVNDSCPNTGHDPQSLVAGAAKKLEAIRRILPGVPVDWKINALTSPQTAKQIIDTGCCDAVTVSNTIPWWQNATWTNNPETRIDWEGLFEQTTSPLKLRGYGNGGLSGWPLLNLVAEWVREAKKIGITIPIKAGGGIQRKADMRLLASAGANAFELGCVGFLRPWRLASLIKYGNKIIK